MGFAAESKAEKARRRAREMDGILDDFNLAAAASGLKVRRCKARCGIQTVGSKLTRSFVFVQWYERRGWE